MEIFDKTLTHLEQALDLRLERQGLLAGNVANANTPGYAPKDINFSAALVEAESSTPGALALAPVPGGIETSTGTAPTTARAAEQTGTAPGFDGNRVDVDRAMVALAENAMQYGAAAREAQKKLAILSYVASDGNG